VTGPVDCLEDDLVGRQQRWAFSRPLDRVDAWAERVDLVEDTGSLHPPPDGLAVVAELPRRVAAVGGRVLPTAAPWLNPMEQRWRWRREEVLQRQRLADAWPTRRARVTAFLGAVRRRLASTAALHRLERRWSSGFRPPLCMTTNFGRQSS
jgi:hypothetical protein